MWKTMNLSVAVMVMALGTQAGAQQPAPATPPAAVAATAPTPPPAPNVGDMAPDFTAPAADSAGARATPVSLRDLRGRVVVVAFYPKDRTSGCTAEMTKFRDEYASLFGPEVTVLPVSLDSMDSHLSWAHDAHFPFTLVSDPSGTIASAYGSLMPGRPYANRTVFVIGKDGRIVYREMKFGALDQHAYDALKDAVAKAKRA